MELLEWYNLIFAAPIGLAGIYLVLSATGIGSEAAHDIHADADLDHDLDVHVDHDVDVHLDHDLDVDLDHDVDVDLDHDVDADLDHDLDVDHDVHVNHDLDVGHDADHDLDADHDVDADHDLEAEHDAHVAVHHEPSFMLRALSVLGFGKVPVSILMTCLMVIFGSVGLICNGVFAHALPWSWGPALYFWPSLGIATMAGLTLTGTVARGLSRVMPTSETYAITPADRVGRIGVAVYALKEGELGVVDVKDEGGTLHRVAAKPLQGEIPKGSEIIVVRYQREGDYYDVSKSPL